MRTNSSVVEMNRTPILWIRSKTVSEKQFSWHDDPSHSTGPWWWRKINSTNLTKQILLKGMYVWGINSKVTKHSDHFVWKDSSERMARRCDYTIDKKRVNCCVLKNHNNALRTVFSNRVLRSYNSWIIYWIDSGPKILRSLFLLWPNRVRK